MQVDPLQVLEKGFLVRIDEAMQLQRAMVQPVQFADQMQRVGPDAAAGAAFARAYGHQVDEHAGRAHRSSGHFTDTLST